MDIQLRSREHRHQFDQGNPLAQKRILYAVILTAVMMVAEIWGGWVFNSMALLADGWHMSSHLLALGLAYLAYRAARYFADDPRFSMGTWKIEILAAYSSAILLILVALFMAIQSIDRLFNPVAIHYQEAIPIAVLGLLINLICAWLLHDGHGHSHAHEHSQGSLGHSHAHDASHAHGASNASHGHSHAHHHAHVAQEKEHAYSSATHHHTAHDLNHRAAFLHVVADAVTSVFAIVALIAAKYWGWIFLDALLGIVGAILVAKWSLGLIKVSAKTLIDADMDDPVVQQIQDLVMAFDATIQITDLHVGKVGNAKFSCILVLESTRHDLTADQLRDLLSGIVSLVHITIEINAPIAWTVVPRETHALLRMPMATRGSAQQI